MALYELLFCQEQVTTCTWAWLAVQCPSSPQWLGSCFSPAEDDSLEKQFVASCSSAASKGWVVTRVTSVGRKWGSRNTLGAIKMPMQRHLRSSMTMPLHVPLLLQKGLLLDMSHSWVCVLGAFRSGHLDCSARVVIVPKGQNCPSHWPSHVCVLPKNKPSQLQGSQPWSLYPGIFTAFQRLPEWSQSLRDHKTLITYLGIAALSLHLLFIRNRAGTAVSVFWRCTWHMIANLKWWTKKVCQFCEKVCLLNVEYGTTAFLHKNISIPMKNFHFMGRKKQKKWLLQSEIEKGKHFHFSSQCQFII